MVIRVAVVWCILVLFIHDDASGDPSSYTEKEHMIEKLNAVGISCIMHTAYKIQTAADEMYIQVFYVFREESAIRAYILIKCLNQ